MEKNEITDLFLDKPYEVRNGKYIFNELELSDVEDDLDKIKSRLKKNYKIYNNLINLVSPVFVGSDLKKFINKWVGEDKVCCNVGSGNTKISDKVINIDIFDYDNVDVVCDIKNLPFKDNTVDIVMNTAVLEHVPNPQAVVDEIYRVLKPGGIVYTAFPFMQGFHASPYDYTRVTEEGIKILHSNFEVFKVKPFGGPTSGMLWVVQEWIAILFSFGNKKLHVFLYILMMLLTFPLKYLDFFLIKSPMAKNISSGFIFIGKKGF